MLHRLQHYNAGSYKHFFVLQPAPTAPDPNPSTALGAHPGSARTVGLTPPPAGLAGRVRLVSTLVAPIPTDTTGRAGVGRRPGGSGAGVLLPCAVERGGWSRASQLGTQSGRRGFVASGLQVRELTQRPLIVCYTGTADRWGPNSPANRGGGCQSPTRSKPDLKGGPGPARSPPPPFAPLAGPH